MRDGSFINIEDFSVEFCFLDDEYFTLPEPPSKYEKFKEKMSSIAWKYYYAIFSIFILIGVPILEFFIPSDFTLYIWFSTFIPYDFAIFFWWTTLLSVLFLAFLDTCNYNGYIFFWLVYISWYLLWFGVI